MHVGGAVHIDSEWLRDVRLGALNPLAGVCTGSLAVVEIIKPESAGISGEGPLTDPNLVLVTRKHFHVVLVLLADCLDSTTLVVPSQIPMVIDDNVMSVLIVKEIVPVLWIVPERVVEDKLEVGCLFTHEVAHVSVEELESPLVRFVPRFVHRLNGIEGRVISPLINEASDSVLRPKQVFEINVVVALAIPRAHPFACLDLPMREMVLSDPREVVLLA